ncbi:SusC/RagA family TonB-linked outer membrane protein [Lewinella sp. IMCC34183]|uniref:SusC/RagA family TonB-linked outer membrane protein n=1 Tax=Lewinella sp. IMCC34183 TaxID=2248762 RepID=UPI000E22E2E8|nr:SusC/RagA family TonB-linked outer membrane protein [Lewinella sp. IMCC34183]
MQRFLTVLALVFGTLGSLLAQQSISGTITDATGEPLIGASILVAGTTTGTVTDFDGTFSLSVPEGGEELIVSYTGFATQRVPLTAASTYDVVLAEGVQLNDVVVTALGISREEKSLGYAVAQVDGADLNKAQETNLVSSLSGRVAGAQINNSNNGLSGSSSILLRGATSITGNNQPLFVVDGTPIDNSSFNGSGAASGDGGQDYGNLAQDINPNDIASVSVLKGGAAAALYGSRASNGVILITTKSGQNRKGVGVTISSGVQFNQVALLPDYQNQYGGGTRPTFNTFDFDEDIHPAEWREFQGQPLVDYSFDGSWGPELDGTLVRHWDSWFPGENFGELRPWVASPDNVRDFYETGVQFNNNVSIAGGNDQTTFRLSYTNNDNSGVYPTSTLKRNTINVSATQKLGSKLTAAINGNYVNTRGAGRPGIGYGTGYAVNVQTNFNQWWQRQLDIDRLKNYQQADGSPRSWNINGPEDLDALYWESPYWTINKDLSGDQRDRVFGNLSLQYDILPGLSLQGFVRTDYFTFRTNSRIASGTPTALDYYETRNITSRENNYEALLNYSTSISEFTIDAQAGANLRKNFYDFNRSKTDGGLNVPELYTIESSISRPIIDNFRSEKEVQSVYGRVSLGWRSLFYVDATARNDWSSTLEAGNNSYFYPSVSSSFVFSELIGGRDIISFGKLRGGVATVGNDTDPYNTRNFLINRGPFGRRPGFGVSNTLNNFDLVSERITTWEVGLDMRFLNDRAGFDFTYYNIESRDLIIPVSISGTSGYGSTYLNAGLLSNKGIELRVYGTPVQTENFTWNTSVNFARNRNQVVELAEGVDRLSIDGSWNVTFLAEKGEPYGSLNGAGYARNDDGDVLVDEEGYPIRETNLDFGSAYPDFTGGFLNDFQIYGFNLSTLIDFRKGGSLYSVSNLFGSYSGVLASTAGNNAKGNPVRDPATNGGGILVEGVREDGTPNETYIDIRPYFETLYGYPEAFIYDASFIKLREVSIGRALPARWFENNFIGNATVSLTGRNLAILHKNTPNIDPEAALSNGNVQGFENGQNPSVRSFGVSLNVGF